MVRSVVSKVMWVGRATVFLVGLAVILALVLGAATMAFAANGDPWRLGQNNVASAITALGGAAGVDGPMVRLTNNDAGTDDTALDLRVQAGEAPMRVNSDTRVANLNADQLDGVDATELLPNSIYERRFATTAGGQPNETISFFLHCRVLGDRVLSGGFDNLDNGTHLIASRTDPTSILGGGHFVEWRNNQTVDTVTITVICADTTP